MRVTSEYYDGGAGDTGQRPETGSRGWTLSPSGPGPIRYQGRLGDTWSKLQDDRIPEQSMHGYSDV